MSFLNPVNEPVLRFSSTDADAPQINYNARSAGDVKAVLKACLVTGYGDKASAGWSIVNEVDHVAEFASPSAAMSDYRLGIDDGSTTKSTWYYQYIASKFVTGDVSKSTAFINNTSPSNGWELLVTNRGVMMIENAYNSAISAMGSNVTYWGQLKSATPSVGGKNTSWWSLGFSSPSPQGGQPSEFFSKSFELTFRHYSLEGTNITSDALIALPIFSAYNSTSPISKVSVINLASEWYLVGGGNIVAQKPGVLLTTKGGSNDIFSVGESAYKSRPVLSAYPIRANARADYTLYSSNVGVIIHLDYWEY